MKPILHTLQTSASEFGLHTYMARLKCARKARLDREKRENHNPSEDALAFQVGTIFHAFMEMYYVRGDFSKSNPSIVEFRQVDNSACDLREEARIEAERLFRAYRIQFDNKELGSVVGSEVLVDNNQAFKDFFGVEHLSSRLDLIIKVNQADCKRILKTRNLFLQPGYYVVDHKTQGRRDNNYAATFQWSPQFALYHKAAEFYLNKQINGTIVNIIFKTKEVGFESLLVPEPSIQAINALKKMFQVALSRDEDEPNLNHCTYPNLCPYFENGQCNRS